MSSLWPSVREKRRASNAKLSSEVGDRSGSRRGQNSTLSCPREVYTEIRLLYQSKRIDADYKIKMWALKKLVLGGCRGGMRFVWKYTAGVYRVRALCL